MAGYDTDEITIYKYGNFWYIWDALVASGHAEDYTETLSATLYTMRIAATDYSTTVVSALGFKMTEAVDFYCVASGGSLYAVRGLHPFYTQDSHPTSWWQNACTNTGYVTVTASTSDADWNKNAVATYVFDAEVQFGSAINMTETTGANKSKIWRSARFSNTSVSWGGVSHAGRSGFYYYIGFFAGYSDVSILTGIRNRVAFDANGGTSGMATQSMYVSGGHLASTQRLAANTIQRPGYVFTGWNTAADGGGTAVPDQGVPVDYGLLSAPYDKTVTLYAQWRTTGFSVTVENALGIGSLYMADASTGSVVATESGGVLSYGTTETPTATYRVTCVLSDGTEIAASMVGAPAGTFTPSAGDELSFEYSPALYALSWSMSDGDVTFSRAADHVDDGVDKWVSGAPLTATIAPKPGRRITGWRVLDEYGATMATGSVTPPQTEPYDLPLNLMQDAAIGATFETAQYAVSALIDAASSTAVTDASVSVKGASGGGAASITVDYGTTVVFHAAVATGYGFAGWFGGGAVQPGTDYEAEITSDLALTAKAAAPVSARCEDMGGEAVVGASVSWTGLEGGYAVLGSEVGYLLNPGAYYLNGWFDKSDTEHENPLPLGMSGSLEVTAPVSLVAQLSAVEPVKTLTVKALPMAGVTPLAVDEFVSFAEVDPSAAAGSEAKAGQGVETYTVTGVHVVRATAAGTVTPEGGVPLLFRGWFLDDEAEEPFASTLSVDILVSSNRSVRVRYGNAASVRVTAAIVDAEAQLSPGVATVNGTDHADVSQGAYVTMRAQAINGWQFAGWFGEPSPVTYADPLSTSAEWVAGPIYAETTFYAHFTRETDFICEWEGSDRNKTLDWRSKTYVATKPFNPTCARVDADGYPLRLGVSVCSSPDTVAMDRRVAAISVKSQDARRLRLMRPERYLRIDVSSDSPVNAVFVGTSMEGLAV